MRKKIGKVFSGFICAALLSSSLVVAVHATDTVLSLNGTSTVIGLNESGNFVEGTYGSTPLSNLSNVTYTSSDTSVLSVNDAGEITENNYGIAVVTASYSGASASVMITVTPAKWTNDDNRNVTSFTGAMDGANIDLKTLLYAKGGNGGVTGIGRRNTVLEGWFYDNGGTTNSESGICFSGYGSLTDTGVVGVLNSGDTTYKISNFTSYPYAYLTPENISSPRANTGIARVKGWHQLVCFQTANPNTESGKKAYYYLYLDGTLIEQDTAYVTHEIGSMFGYAGSSSATTAYVKNASISDYVNLKNVTATYADGQFTANYTYTGTYPATASGSDTAEETSNRSVSYKWYYADTSTGTYTAISGATSATYTPSAALADKYFKVGVTVTDKTLANISSTSTQTQYTTNEVLSAALKAATKTEITYSNGTATILAANTLSGAVLITAQYDDVSGGYKKLNNALLYTVNCTAGNTVSVQVGTLSAGCKILLWNGMDTMFPICSAYTVQ